MSAAPWVPLDDRLRAGCQRCPRHPGVGALVAWLALVAGVGGASFAAGAVAVAVWLAR